MKNNDIVQPDDEQKGLIKSKYNRILELYIWMFLALIILFPVILNSSRYRRGIDFFLDFYNQFIIAFLLFLVPTLFKLIFGKLPFEYLRSKREPGKGINIQGSSNVHVILGDQKSPLEKQTNYMYQCIEESKSISEKIFTRAGVYLLVGCLIAFIGITLFFSPIFKHSTSTDITQRLMDYLPRFGSLFFIEFIAFFFLKQYRIMLEEYRYYEAIKRKRQDDYNMIELIEKHKDDKELLKILPNNISSTLITKLSNGETTEILETQKLVNSDLDIFSKFLELIKEVKK